MGRDMGEVEIFETDIQKIQDACERSGEENMSFRDFVKSKGFDRAMFNRIVDEVERRIECTDCGNCCKVLFPVVTDQDIHRIAVHLGISDEFMNRYVTKSHDGKPMFKRRPCIFQQDKRCRIYDVRPRICRLFPELRKDPARHTYQLLFTARICPIVFNVIENTKRLMWRK